MSRRMPQDEAERILANLNAVLVGHFVGTAGDHLAGYVSKDVPIRHPQELHRLGAGIAMLTIREEVDVVIAPPMGAINLGFIVAQELGCEFAFLEEVYEPVREEEIDGAKRKLAYKTGRLEFKRPTFQEAVRGKRVGIVEDVFTTGLTTVMTIAAVISAGGTVVWVSGLYNRGGVTAEFLGVDHLFCLVERRLDKWTPEQCAIDGPCSRHEPINLSPGHGASYQAAHPDYPGGYV